MQWCHTQLFILAVLAPTLPPNTTYNSDLTIETEEGWHWMPALVFHSQFAAVRYQADTDALWDTKGDGVSLLCSHGIGVPQGCMSHTRNS